MADSGDLAAVGTADPDEWVAVGVVRGAFGVQGALKIEPYSDLQSTVLNRIRTWRIDAPRRGPGSAGLTGAGAEVSVTTARTHGGCVIATIDPPLSREQALDLKGAQVHVRRRDFPAPGPDEYYWADLIGSAVVDPSGQALGTVEALDDHGAQSVLRLDNGILIPFVAAVILEVAPAQKRIVADWSADWL